MAQQNEPLLFGKNDDEGLEFRPCADGKQKGSRICAGAPQ